MLETERGKNVAARHHEKAGEPSPRELLGGRAGKAFGRVAQALFPSVQQPGAPALGREGLVADGA